MVQNRQQKFLRLLLREKPLRDSSPPPPGMREML
jgi:hypothetical protein